MEIRQLKYFLKVAETLNFSEASRRLYITQSTLSQQISHLEQELGVPLFKRNSHKVCLTEAGKELLPYAQKTIIAADSCLNHIENLRQMLTGELHIGVTYSFSTILSETLIDFLRAHPGVKLNIYYQTMEDLLAFKPIVTDKSIDSRTIFSNRLAAIVNAGHPLARQTSVQLTDLERYELLLPSRGLQARNTFEKLAEAANLNFKIKVEVNNVDIIFHLLHRTNYVTVLSESTVVREEGLKAVPIACNDNEMVGCIHLLKDSYIKNSAQEFIRMLSHSTSVFANFALKDILSSSSHH